MKQILYAASMALLLSACGGSKEYDAFVEALNRQIEAVDTLSTPQAFAARMDSVTKLGDEFALTGAKLNKHQQATLDSVSTRLQESFFHAYERIAATPVTLPDSVEVPDEMPVLQ